MWTNFTRVVTFLLGAGGFMHEMIIHQGVERPFIISASCALMGLPLVALKDSQRRENDKE